jgi:penicillin amidase
MSFDLASYENDFELTNARRILGAADFEKLYPIIQDSLDPIIPRGTLFEAPAVVVTPPAKLDSTLYNTNIDTSANIALTEPKPDPDNGSNNWAVGGTKTKSGRPILANDPHLGLNLPSLWYEMQLSTPEMNVYGVTFPGAPSVIIGFNDSCAWGVTNAGRDVRDYYEIKFKDTTMQEYWFNNQWMKAETRPEVIKIKDSADLIENIAMTVFGPVMYDKKYPSRSKDGKYYACRWKAHDGSNELLTFNKLNKAKNYIDYVDAIATFQTPGQNFLFASKSGDVAIRQQGQFPAKWNRQGDFLMPGEDSSYMWQGMIPVKENPQVVNHARGYASSANQLPVDATYPYYLGGSFSPYRGISVNKRLDVMNNITADDMMKLQTDNYNVFAEDAMPVLLKYMDENALNADEKNMYQLVKNWNMRNDVAEKGASIFRVWWDSIEAEIYTDEIAKLNGVSKWPDESTLVEGLLRDSTDYSFIDNVSTTAQEDLSSNLVNAFKKAYPALKKANDEKRLEWAAFKNTGVRHLLRIAALSRLGLNIGGGDHIINATKQYHGPSWRVVVHLTDEIEAYGVYPGGQSGNPGSKYYDTFIDSWTEGKYYSLLFLKKQDSRKTNKIKWRMTFIA